MSSTISAASRMDVWFGLVLGLVALLGPAPTPAVPLGKDTVSFETVDEPLRVLGDHTRSFEVVVVDSGEQSRTFGKIELVDVPNPARLSYDAKLQVCAVALSEAECKNGLGSDPPPGKLALCRGTGLSSAECRNGLGSAPPATLAVKDGAEATVSGFYRRGVSGEITLGRNTVDVLYQADVDVSVSNAAPAPGETVVLTLAPGNEAGSIAGDFVALDASIVEFRERAYAFGIEAYERGLELVNAHGSIPEEQSESPLLSLVVDDDVGAGGIPSGSVSAFGREIEALQLSTEFHKEVVVPVPNIPVGIPVGDVTVFVPDFDMEPPGEVIAPLVDGRPAWLRNSTLPVTRVGGGRTPIDFARVDSNGAILCLTVIVLGCAGVEVGNLAASIQLTGNDGDLGLFFGLAQTSEFDPGLVADITFSRPVPVNLGLGTSVQSRVVKPVSDAGLVFTMPEGDLDIDIFYRLDENHLDTDIDLMLSPAFTLTQPEIIIDGTSQVIAPLKGTYFLDQETMALGDPRPIRELLADVQTLEGFEAAPGGRISFASGQAATFLPGVVSPDSRAQLSGPPAALLLAAGLVLLVGSRQYRR